MRCKIKQKKHTSILELLSFPESARLIVWNGRYTVRTEFLPVATPLHTPPHLTSRPTLCLHLSSLRPLCIDCQHGTLTPITQSAPNRCAIRCWSQGKQVLIRKQSAPVYTHTHKKQKKPGHTMTRPNSNIIITTKNPPLSLLPYIKVERKEEEQILNTLHTL